LEHIIDKIVILNFSMLFFFVVCGYYICNEVNLTYNYKLGKFVLGNDVPTISEVELANKAKENKENKEYKDGSFKISRTQSQYFHIIGTLKSHERLQDELFNIHLDHALKLQRNVERFREEVQEGGSIKRSWVQVDSVCPQEDVFIASKSFEAQDLWVGNLKCSPHVLSYMRDQMPLTIKSFDPSTLGRDLQNTLSLND